MDEKLQQEIYDLCPHVYADVGLPKNKTCMYYGLSCSDGWYEIIKELSIGLEALIVEWIKENPDKLTISYQTHPRAKQVKEKFATLTFYLMPNATDEMMALITEASLQSNVTCERCGEFGELRRGGWMLTLCAECNSPEGREKYAVKQEIITNEFFNKMEEDKLREANMGEHSFEGVGEFVDTDVPYELIDALEAHASEVEEFDGTHSSLDCWLEAFPDFEDTEAQLLLLHNRMKSLPVLRYPSKEDYFAECHSIEHDTIMLERVLAKHYEAFVPDGVDLVDVEIGSILRCNGRWLVTDKGSFNAIAIRYNPYDPSWMIGPPYPVNQVVWDEFELKGCSLAEIKDVGS